MTGGTDPKVARLLAKPEWHAERQRLRALLLAAGLTEAVKWGKLCYAQDGDNVAMIFALKAYCAIGFFKGALIDDTAGVLVSPGPNSQAMRQLRFEDAAQIETSEALIRDYVERAIAIEREGRTIDFDEKHNLDYPPELQTALDDDSALADAFAALTPGRRRGYVIHITDARQTATRKARIERSRANILAGKGRNGR